MRYPPGALLPKLLLFIGALCPYCKRTMDDDLGLQPTRDHYPIPKSRGGTRMIICCKACNGIKGDMSADDWTAFMAANPGWWAVPKKTKPVRSRGVRFIKSPETPSNPMREVLSQIKFTGMVARGFNDMVRRKR